MRALLLAAGMAVAAAAAPLTPEKIELLPGLYPKERRELAQRLLGRAEGVREALVEAGIDPRVAERIDRLPPGPLLVERYAHEIPLEAPGLSPEQRELLQHLHPAVLAAQWALSVQRERLADALKGDDVRRRQVTESFDRQIREIEKRYWRIVGYALTEEQRVAIHPLLPQPYQRPPGLERHVFQVPGLTLAQAGRLRSLIAEFESESAADGAEVRRLEAQLKEGPDPAAAAARDAAIDRLAGLLRGIVERANAILTPEQLRYIDSLPPLLGPEETMDGIVAELGLTPEQQERLKPLVDEVRRAAEEAQRRAEERTRELRDEVSGESPQMMTMQMMQQGAAGEIARARFEAARKALLGIVDKRQVLAWILSPR
jgi:hypothetical protein